MRKTGVLASPSLLGSLRRHRGGGLLTIGVPKAYFVLRERELACYRSRAAAEEQAQPALAVLALELTVTRVLSTSGQCSHLDLKIGP